MKKVVFVALFAALIAGPASAIAINSPETDVNLVNEILGAGVAVVGGSISYTGNINASGTFTDGFSSGIGIDSGIILTTGSAADAVGPNTLDNTTTNNGLAGDADLTALVGAQTFDATVLEFEFTTAGGDLFFNYVFASEEYNEFTNSAFNDVFAFYLDGVNIALLPGGGGTEVSINTVNGGNPLGVGATNPGLYNNNDLTDGPPPHDIEYDGFTDVFRAEALGIGAGSHTIKLAIADTSDRILDSAVFIEAGTFSDTSTPIVPEPATMTLMGLGMGMVAYRRRKQQA